MSDKYLPNIGELAHEGALRDAIHIAVAPVVSADDWLSPGDEVGFVLGSNTKVKGKDRVYGQDVIGVVDPFLRDHVRKGERFWVFLLPNTITFLRHHWEHPAFVPAPPPSSDSEAWLRRFADEWNFNYDDMIREASDTSPSEWGHYVVAMGRDLHSRGELGSDEPLFWQHLEAMTGQKFSDEHRENFGWSCSC
jgi:hypothetical protein